MLAKMSVENPVRCAVLGAGSFGTCLAILLAEKGHEVDLWARDAHLADAIARDRRNPRYLTRLRAARLGARDHVARGGARPTGSW